MGLSESLERAAMWNNVGTHDPRVDQAVASYLGQQAHANALENAAILNYNARMQGRAAGGPVEENQPYVVGEQGPEVIVPQQRGTVIPHKSLADLVPNLEWRGVVPGRSLAEAAKAVEEDLSPGGKLPTDQYGRPVYGPYQHALLQHKMKLAELAASPQGRQAARGQAEMDKKEATEYFLKMLKDQYGVREVDEKGRPVLDTNFNPLINLPAYVETARLKALPQIRTMEDIPKILEQLGPGLETSKTIAGLDTETNRAKALANVRRYRQSQGLPPDPATEQLLLKGQITPENYRGLQGWLNYGTPKPAGPGTTPGQTSSARPPSLQDAARQVWRPSVPGSYTKLGELVPERIFTGANRGAAPVEGAPGILQTDKGDQFARTYRPAPGGPGGAVAMDVPTGATQTISKADLLTPEYMAMANKYMASVKATPLDAEFMKAQPDAAAGMILDSLNKWGIRNKGPVYRLAQPEEAAGLQGAVSSYGKSLADLARTRETEAARPPRFPGELATSGMLTPVPETPPLQPVYDWLGRRSRETAAQFERQGQQALSDLQSAARVVGDRSTPPRAQQEPNLRDLATRFFSPTGGTTR